MGTSPVLYAGTAGGVGNNLSSITNANGTSNTAVLSHIWMTPTTYNTDTVGWGTVPNSVSSATCSSDLQAAGANGLGSPHPNVCPTLFGDGHVSNIPYTWTANNFYISMWNWQNNTAIVFPN
jgi:prepilin-type processing-associated H-X9-DG protein